MFFDSSYRFEKEILSILSPNLYFNMSCASLAKTTPLSLFVGRPIISELVKFPNLIHAPAKQTTIAMISNSQRKDFLYFFEKISVSYTHLTLPTKA